MAPSARDVFINCPFDVSFTTAFQALVFAVISCGYRARCALEVDDAAETRIEKLYRIIEQSRYGIHDISKTELDAGNNLPRFNMPLELGIFLGAKRFGADDQNLKRCLIFDREQYRFQQFISDIAGMDIRAHSDNPHQMIICVRNFLVTVSRRKAVPPHSAILESYDEFQEALPDIAARGGLQVEDMMFPDYERLVIAWVQNRPFD